MRLQVASSLCGSFDPHRTHHFTGSTVCLDGNARHAIANRSAQAKKCLSKWRPVLISSRLPRKLRVNIVKTTMLQALALEFDRVDDGQGTKRQHYDLECENGGEREWN